MKKITSFAGFFFSLLLRLIIFHFDPVFFDNTFINEIEFGEMLHCVFLTHTQFVFYRASYMNNSHKIKSKYN